MNSPEPRRPSREEARAHQPELQNSATEEPSQGPNLVVLYSILALALLIAISLAIFIVLPFYHRR